MTRTMHCLCLLVSLTASSLLLAQPVRAQAETGALPSNVVEAAERGRQLFDEGQYEEAAEFLLAAYEEHREPIFLQYVGRCKQELGLFCQAARYYRLFLSQGDPPPELRGQLEGRMIELDEQCEAETEPSMPNPVEDSEPGDTESPTTFGHQQEPDVQRSSYRTTDLAGIVLMASGGLLVAVATPLWAVGAKRYWEAEDDYNAATTDEAQNGAANQEAEESRPLRASGDVIGLAFGIPIFTAGLITFLVGRLRARNQANVSFSPGFASGRLSVFW